MTSESGPSKSEWEDLDGDLPLPVGSPYKLRSATSSVAREFRKEYRNFAPEARNLQAAIQQLEETVGALFAQPPKDGSVSSWTDVRGIEHLKNEILLSRSASAREYNGQELFRRLVLSQIRLELENKELNYVKTQRERGGGDVE